MLNSESKIGFWYKIEHVRNGRVLACEEVQNVVPTEGLNHILSVVLKGGSQQASWYIGIYEGNYTPVGTETAANIASVSTECTAYDEVTREVWTGGTVAAGAVSNVDSKAEFTINAAKAVYGGFLVSASAKGAATGTLLSVVRFPTVKNVEASDILRIAGGLTTVST